MSCHKDPGNCQLLTGLFAYTIQIVLAIAAFLSLVLKRYIERPQRPWKIWAFDVGKQLVGGGFIHFSNILVSGMLQDVMGADSDQCAWYFLNFFIDCSLGVIVVFLAHKALCRVGTYFYGPESALAHIGEYGEPPSPHKWGIQLTVWLMALLINKVFVSVMLYVARDGMNAFGNWLFGPVQCRPQLELVIVMVLCPWILTMIQYWIFDLVLKAKKKESGLLDDVESVLHDASLTECLSPTRHVSPRGMIRKAIGSSIKEDSSLSPQRKTSVFSSDKGTSSDQEDCDFTTDDSDLSNDNRNNTNLELCRNS